MLAEINLLPKKEQKSYALTIFLIVMAIISLTIGGYLYYTYTQSKAEIAQLTSTLNTTRELIATEQAKAEVEAMTDSIHQLESFIDWSESHPLKAVPILNELTALLPERGFFLNYSYTQPNTVQLTVQFDTSIESSFYLDELLISDWTEEVKLTSLSATKGFDQYELDGTEETESDGMFNEEFVPRYEAQYEVTLNIASLQEKQTEKKADLPSSEEGDGSDD